MRIRALVTITLSALLCICGCASAKKDAAEAAIATSTVAFAAMRDDAHKYSPAQAVMVESALQIARKSLVRGDYGTALGVAKDIPSQIQELSASIKDRKDELLEDWQELSEAVPALMRASQSSIEHLDRAHGDSTEPRQVLIAAQKQWQSANNSYNADELLTAVVGGRTTKATLLALQDSLDNRLKK